ncbi:MAG: lasso peptide biosynthesis PqqD family chaperone [Candidatus Aminicenantes bacterium]|nr:lasso peptide biosynthesis PqqD family chaperone [Candidatus Aminicenantes bacterium]
MTKTTKITIDSVLKPDEKHLSSDLENELVMMNIEKGMYHGLDAVGTRIWELLKEKRTLSEVCRQLQREYDVDKDTCEKDTLNFARELYDAGLVEIVSE